MWNPFKRSDVIDLTPMKIKAKPLPQSSSPVTPTENIVQAPVDDSFNFFSAIAEPKKEEFNLDHLKVKLDDFEYKLDSFSKRLSALIDRVDLAEKKIDRFERRGV